MGPTIPRGLWLAWFMMFIARQIRQGPNLPSSARTVCTGSVAGYNRLSNRKVIETATELPPWHDPFRSPLSQAPVTD